MSFSSPTGSTPEIGSRAARFYNANVPGGSSDNFSLVGGTQATISSISVVWGTTSTFEVTVAINGELIFGAQITGTPTFVLGTFPFYIYDLPIFEGDVVTITTTEPTDPLSFANAYVTIWGRVYGADT